MLVPFGNNLDLIHRYADLIFHHREVLLNPVRIEILNATKEPGIARNTANFLVRFGFNFVNIDNLYDKDGEKKYAEKSYIRYTSWEVDKDGNVIASHRPTLDTLADFVKGEAVPSDELRTDEQVDISIVLGEDYEVY